MKIINYMIKHVLMILISQFLLLKESKQQNKVQISSTFSLYYQIQSPNIQFNLFTSNIGWSYIGFGSNPTLTDILLQNKINNLLQLQDMYSISQQQLPQTDISLGGKSDITIINQSIINNTRQIAFQRPLNTQDNYDYIFTNNSYTDIIWAQGSNDNLGLPAIQGIIRQVLITDQQQCAINCQICTGPEQNHCQKCNNNYYFDSTLKKCDYCGNQCASCNSISQCQQCQPNYYLDPNNQCSSCSNPNQYKNALTGTCTVCDPNCISCGSDIICQQCNDGYYLLNSKCLPCVPNCKVCINANTCTQCKQQYLLHNNQCSGCLNNYYLDNNQNCKPCHYTCLTCFGPQSNQCNSCNSNVILVNNQCNYQCTSNCNQCFGPGFNQCYLCTPPFFIYQNTCIDEDTAIKDISNFNFNAVNTAYSQLNNIYKVLVIVSRKYSYDRMYCNVNSNCFKNPCINNICVCNNGYYGQFCHLNQQEVVFLKTIFVKFLENLAHVIFNENSTQYTLIQQLTLTELLLQCYDIWTLQQVQSMLTYYDTKIYPIITKFQSNNTDALLKQQIQIIIFDIYGNLLNILEYLYQSFNRLITSDNQQQSIQKIRIMQQKVIDYVNKEVQKNIPNEELQKISIIGSRIQSYYYYLDLSDLLLKSIEQGNFSLTLSQNNVEGIIEQNNNEKNILLNVICYQTFKQNQQTDSLILEIKLRNVKNFQFVYLDGLEQEITLKIARIPRYNNSVQQECSQFDYSSQQHQKLQTQISQYDQNIFICNITTLSSVFSVQFTKLKSNVFQNIIYGYAFWIAISNTILLLICFASVLVFFDQSSKQTEKLKNISIPLMELKNKSYNNDNDDDDAYQDNIPDIVKRKRQKITQNTLNPWMAFPVYSIINSSNAQFAIQKCFLTILFYYFGYFMLTFLAWYKPAYIMTENYYIFYGYAAVQSAQIFCYFLGSISYLLRYPNRVNPVYWIITFPIYICLVVFTFYFTYNLELIKQHWLFLGLVIFFCVDFAIDVIILIIMSFINDHDKLNSFLSFQKLRGYYQ